MRSRPRKSGWTAGVLPSRPTAARRFTDALCRRCRGSIGWSADGVAVPAGWNWRPAVEPAIVRNLLGLAAGDIALWHEDGRWEQIEGDAFVRATRAAVRETEKNFRL